MRPAPEILCIADAGSAIGGGHVMRSLTLARALRALGARCLFLENDDTRPVLDTFGPDVERVTEPGPADIVLVDHYRLTLAQETALNRFGPLVVIDDLARPHAAKVVLDPSFGRRAQDYSAEVVLVGADYALVRPEFAAARAGLTRGGEVRRVLVSLGLTDVDAITGRVVAALEPLVGEAMIVAVTGHAAPSLPQLERLAEDGRLELHVDARNMATLTAEADVAVGAGGSSVWERACLGLPSITLMLADNQRPTTLALEKAGALLAIERLDDLDRRLGAAWSRLSDPLTRAGLSKTSADLCDGRGAERAAKAIIDLI